MRAEVSAMNLIKKLPKVDLHVHLDGSVKPSTTYKLAQIQGIELPVEQPEQLLPFLQVQNECKSLLEYLNKFSFVSQVLHTKAALEIVAFEIVEQAYQANCKYIEVRFGPQLHRQKGLSLEEVVESVVTGLKKGETQYGVKANAILCCLRHHSKALNLEVIKIAAKYLGVGVVGVDLAGDEASYPAHLFKDIFGLASEIGIPVTIHAGEADGPENIKTAITSLGASRIGHGVRLNEDQQLLSMVTSGGVPLEMCPTSNIQTGASANWEEYPIREYFNLGIPITVNTDNLTVSNTTLSNEYFILYKHLGFSIGDLGQIIMNTVDASFLNKKEKKKLKSKCLLEYSRLISTMEMVI